MRSFFVTGLFALACLACCAGAAQAAPNNMVALGTGANMNTLYRFSGESPGTVAAVPVTGLGGSTLVGIDYRPSTGELIGLGVAGSVTALFAIDPTSGTATQVGAPSTVPPIATATAFGISFNPTVDRLRVIDDLGNNFRINPNTGAAVGPPFDVSLSFTALPGGNAEAPEVAVSYDRKVLGTTKSTMYGIVSGGDRLVLQGGVDGTPSPNGGILTGVGPLGVDVTANTGFDIDPTTGEAFMAAESGDRSGLYRVDLTTGAATSVGQIGDGSVDIGSLTVGGPAFVPPPPPPPPAEPKLEALSVSPKAFVPAKDGESIKPGSKGKPARGTTVSYVLSAKAIVAFHIEHKHPGRLVAGKCKRLTNGNRDNKSCPLWTMVQASARARDRRGVAGGNSFSFDGRIRPRRRPPLPGSPRTRALAPGLYRFVASLGSTTLTANFTIVPAITGPAAAR